MDGGGEDGEDGVGLGELGDLVEGGKGEEVLAEGGAAVELEGEIGLEGLQPIF